VLSPRAAAVALGAMAVLVGAVAVLGLSTGAVLLAALGLPSGFAAGVALYDAAETEIETGWFTSARNGFVFVGFGGILLIAGTWLVSIVWTPIVTADTPALAAGMLSPLGIMVFATEGAAGAVAGAWVGQQFGGTASIQGD
jgi:hypothetical protein